MDSRHDEISSFLYHTTASRLWLGSGICELFLAAHYCFCLLMAAVLLATHDCSWLLLAAPDCSYLLLADSHWTAPGCSHLLQAALDLCQLLLVACDYMLCRPRQRCEKHAQQSCILLASRSIRHFSNRPCAKLARCSFSNRVLN